MAEQEETLGDEHAGGKSFEDFDWCKIKIGTLENENRFCWPLEPEQDCCCSKSPFSGWYFTTGVPEQSIQQTVENKDGKGQLLDFETHTNAAADSEIAPHE